MYCGPFSCSGLMSNAAARCNPAANPRSVSVRPDSDSSETGRLGRFAELPRTVQPGIALHLRDRDADRIGAHVFEQVGHRSQRFVDADRHRARGLQTPVARKVEAVQRLFEQGDAKVLEAPRLPQRGVDPVATVRIDLQSCDRPLPCGARRSSSRSPCSPCMPIFASNIV